MSEFDYASIKALAAERGESIRDLIALAPVNDPFYCGTRADISRAEWFAELWQRFDFPSGVHLRRIHYVLMSQDPPVLCRNGKPYENTEEDWTELAVASKAARYLGLVEIDAFDDRRNPPPVVNDEAHDGFIGFSPENLNLYVALPAESSFTPGISVDNVLWCRRYHLEVWCEKSTMNDVLLPLCGEMHANLVTGLGELSITACDRLIRRLSSSSRRRPARIFYVSDFDPAGQSMPVAVARKLEFMVRKGARDLDIRLYPIVLTEEQIEEYRLPRVPIKESERRRETFESTRGAGATELDALEALHPGELEEIIRAHLERYRDSTIDDEIAELEGEMQSAADERAEHIYSQHAGDLEAASQSLNELRKSVSAWNRRHSELASEIRAELEEAAEDLATRFDAPEEAEADELEDPLLDTRRDYLEQLTHYHRFQRRDGEAN